MMKNDKVKNLAADNEDRYIRKCIKSLKEKNLPLTGWECIEVYDCKEVERDAPLRSVRSVAVIRSDMFM